VEFWVVQILQVMTRNVGGQKKDKYKNVFTLKADETTYESPLMVAPLPVSAVLSGQEPPQET